MGAGKSTKCFRVYPTYKILEIQENQAKGPRKRKEAGKGFAGCRYEKLLYLKRRLPCTIYSIELKCVQSLERRIKKNKNLKDSFNNPEENVNV